MEIREKIEFRAYELYQHRGGAPGHEFQDWLQAEQEILSGGNKRELTTPVESFTSHVLDNKAPAELLLDKKSSSNSIRHSTTTPRRTTKPRKRPPTM